MVWTLAGSAVPAQGASAGAPRTLRVWTARALATVLTEVGPEFERESGLRLDVVSDLPPAFARRAASGEVFDLLITNASVVDEWIAAGRVVADGRTEIARSSIGVAVRAGAPKPDVSSVDAFRRTLLDAKSIAYLRVGSGLHVASLIERFGLTEALAAKTRRPEGDSVSALVAGGDVALGVVVITQIMTTPGVELAGPLPAEIQSYVTFAAAVSANASAADAARRLIQFLQRPTVGRVITAQGMERAPFR